MRAVCVTCERLNGAPVLENPTSPVSIIYEKKKKKIKKKPKPNSQHFQERKRKNHRISKEIIVDCKLIAFNVVSTNYTGIAQDEVKEEMGGKS